MAELPPLTSVQVMLRRREPYCNSQDQQQQLRQQSNARSQVAELPHVALTSLVLASKRNFRRLLPRLAVHEPADMDPHCRVFNCSKALVSAVENDNLEMIEWLHGYCPEVHPHRAMIKAAENGNASILKWLVKYHAGRASYMIPVAIGAVASHGNIEVLEWLDEYFNSDAQVCVLASAAQGGHLHAVKYLYKRYFY